MKEFIRELLEKEDILLNGSRPWDLTIHNEDLYKRLLINTELSFGESYMDGWWDCEHLDQLFEKILRAKLSKKILKHPKFWMTMFNNSLYKILYSTLNFQTKKKSLVVGEKHYDIGNDLYYAMLDKRMVYTCAYWENATTLDQAQENKLELVCKKLQLKPGMKLLDIGCGWGSFAKFAAENYHVSVVGITISEQQRLLGEQLCRNLPIQLRFQDYRDLLNTSEQYDRIVSLGMFEHVGYKNYLSYMKAAAHVLKPDGLFLLHTIGGNSSTSVTDRWINTYIFPHGHLPSIAQIGQSIEKIFIMEDWQNIGLNYDKTLMSWHANFNNHWDALKQNYSERFRRMWNYFLLASAASFRSRNNQVWQILLSNTGLKTPFRRP